MDGNHPKRRKDKYNPYTIGTTEDGRHWLAFTDGQGNGIILRSALPCLRCLMPLSWTTSPI